MSILGIHQRLIRGWRSLQSIYALTQLDDHGDPLRAV